MRIRPLVLLSLCAGCAGAPATIDESEAALAPTVSNIRHLVILEQENHTFDNYFGAACTGTPPAPTASDPTPPVDCNVGFGCCEPLLPTVACPQVNSLDDAYNEQHEPVHTTETELHRMHLSNGQFKMDLYPCSTHAAVFAGNYELLALFGALADRYFQPIAGASSSNDMFLARAGFVFQDNRAVPNDASGDECQSYCAASDPDPTHCTTNAPNQLTRHGQRFRAYKDENIATLLQNHQVSWRIYLGGYKGACTDGYPDDYDPADNPFDYYRALRDSSHMHKFSQFAADIANGKLPSVSWIRARGNQSEHPGSSLSAGYSFVGDVVGTINGSPYKDNTLFLLTWDEGGGFYDHVSPPLLLADGTPLPTAAIGSDVAIDTQGTSLPAQSTDPECYRCTVDPSGQQYYGTRVPLLALGPFIRQDSYISHVVMEHSSLVKFIEWNWLPHPSGQLNTRDAHVNNIGSLLSTDVNVIGIAVPEGTSD